MTALRFPIHYRVLHLLLMAFSIVVHTDLACSARGAFLDDLTNHMFANTSIFPILQNLLSKSSGRWEMAQDSSYTFQPRKPPPPLMIVSRLMPYAADQRVSFLQAIGFSRVWTRLAYLRGF